IEIQQPVHLIVYKSHDDSGRQVKRGGSCEQVSQQRTVVPAEMAICARPIFPGITPVDCRADQGSGGGRNRRLEPSCSGKRAAIVSCTQAAEREIAGIEVIDACLKVRKVAAYQVQLDLVECSGAGCSPEEYLTNWKSLV